MNLQRKVKAFVTRHGLLSRGDHVLVAVSGGPDSVALLHILNDLHEELGIELEVAHLQHGMRGEEARGDARFVGELAEKLGLEFHLREVDVPQMRSDRGKGNLEALARGERYRFFAEIARQRNVNKVATGHTLDDQAETVLMRFMRGAGMKGLGGMAPARRTEAANDGPLLIRPLLGISKAQVLAFLEEKQMAYRIDRTNRETKLLRNWVRAELLPELKRRIDPRLSARLAQAAELLRDEEAFLAQLAQAKLESIRGPSGVNRALLRAEPRAIQRRVLRLWIEKTRGDLGGIDFTHIDQLLKLIDARAPQGRLSIPGGWDLSREYETLRLARRSGARQPLCYSYEVEIGAELNIPEAGMTIRSRYITAPLAGLPENFNEAVFDAAALPTALKMRNFRRGDHFRPLGMAGHKKVKDLFIEKKVPFSIRAAVPLLSSGREILWIPGYGRSEVGKVHAQTASMVRFQALSLRP